MFETEHADLVPMRWAVTLMVTLLIAVPASCPAQNLKYFHTQIIGRPDYFEGQPIYLLIQVENRRDESVSVLARNELIDAGRLLVADSAGRNLQHEWLVIDRFYGGAVPQDTIPPRAVVQWISPLHWFWGVYRDSLNSVLNYAFAPGAYTVAPVFPPSLGIATDTFRFTVRARSPSEEEARLRLLAGIHEVRSAIRAAARLDAGLPALQAMLADSQLADYREFLLCDFVGALQGEAPAYSPTFRPVLDSLRLAAIATDPVAASTSVRLLETIPDDRLLDLARQYPQLVASPYLSARLAGYRRQVRPN